MRTIGITLILLMSYIGLRSQSYTYYPTGDTSDVSPPTLGGTCMMGGASENDEAMVWFLERAGGGNVVVIRASGSDGYNDYMYSELGVDLQSVETIVFNSAAAASDPFVLGRIAGAEAIWMAGGDQWDYVSYWQSSEVRQSIDSHVNQKFAPIGGTSAGMAVLGDAYFSAENGTVTSTEALADPYRDDITIGYDDFLSIPYLENVITDSHYDDPDRKGRHMVFLARLATDHGIVARGIACDEYTAVCIDENGMARVFGEYPDYDENAYFLQANCETETFPETCVANTPLDWNRGQAAVKVYDVYGTYGGQHTFDLTTWESGDGGQWRNWWVQNGELLDEAGDVINCVSDIPEWEAAERYVRYDARVEQIHILDPRVSDLRMIDLNGRISRLGGGKEFIDLSGLAEGIHILRFTDDKGLPHSLRIVK